MKKRKGEPAGPGRGCQGGEVYKEKKAPDRAQRNEHVLLIINKDDGQDTPLIIPRFRHELSELQLGRGDMDVRRSPQTALHCPKKALDYQVCTANQRIAIFQ